MAKNFSETERKILSLVKPGTMISYQNEPYVIELSGKPMCSKGEPKTDVYISCNNLKSNAKKEIKISFKQKNAEFIENKIVAKRAEQLFGINWASIITDATERIRSSFQSRKLIFKNKNGRTEAGSITLGWRFEILNKSSGDLSGKLTLTPEQVLDIYAGTHLSLDKRNASVNGRIIPNSGIATHILFEESPISTAQDVFDEITPISEYIKTHPDVYFACKALNYRSNKEEGRKIEGNRSLAVFVYWFASNGKLCYELIFDKPLDDNFKGKDACNFLEAALTELNVKEINNEINFISKSSEIIF